VNVLPSYIHPLGQTNIQTPPQFYLLPIHVLHPGQINTTINTNQPHPCTAPDHHRGLSSPTTSTRPYETAGTLNVGLKPNLGGFQIKFSFDLHIFIFISIAHLIIQICAHYYTPTSPYQYHHTHSVILATLLCLLSLSSLVV